MLRTYVRPNGQKQRKFLKNSLNYKENIYTMFKEWTMDVNLIYDTSEFKKISSVTLQWFNIELTERRVGVVIKAKIWPQKSNA